MLQGVLQTVDSGTGTIIWTELFPALTIEVLYEV